MAEVKIYVLDACALIAFFRDEPGGDKLEALFAQAPEKQFIIHSVNVGEIYYDTLRTSGITQATSIFKDIQSLPIKIVWSIDESLLVAVGRFKTQCRISYADAYVLALADREKACVISTDHHEFDAVDESGVVAFEWIR